MTFFCFLASRSRSPVRRGRSYDRDGGSRSPKRRDSPDPAKTRKRSLTPDDGIPQKARDTQKDDEMNGSPRGKSRSSLSPERESPVGRRRRSPKERNGRSQSPNASPSPREDRSPVEDDDDDNRRSPRGSEST